VSKFSRKKYKQLQFTKIIAETHQVSWTTLRRTIWFTPTDDDSLRLTFNGVQFLMKAGYSATIVQLKTSHPLGHLTNRNLLELDRYYPSVYFVSQTKNLYIFDEECASMLLLLDGDLDRYIAMLKN
jgi:hypothetical protein